MGFALFVIFVIWPVLEIVMLVLVADQIGWGWALLGLVGLSLLGVLVIRGTFRAGRDIANSTVGTVGPIRQKLAPTTCGPWQANRRRGISTAGRHPAGDPWLRHRGRGSAAVAATGSRFGPCCGRQRHGASIPHHAGDHDSSADLQPARRRRAGPGRPR